VFDRLGVHSILMVGGSVGFLSTIILKLTDDLKALRPTVFPSVPRLLNKVYDRVVAGVKEKSAFQRFMFYQGVNTKLSYYEAFGWCGNRIIDNVVLAAAKERLGGRVRIMITASAPISA
jgi:long-chain acyl-CoA synthetase